MNKKIIITACIVFALIFVVILAVMMGTISQKANDANTQLVDTLNSVSGLDLSSYDGKDIKGNVVVNAINNSNNSSTKLFYYVTTLEGNTDAIYGYGSKTSGDGGQLLSNLKASGSTFNKTVYSSNTFNTYDALPNDADYINEKATFSSKLIKNANDMTVGIYFVQVSAS